MRSGVRDRFASGAVSREGDSLAPTTGSPAGDTFIGPGIG